MQRPLTDDLTEPWPCLSDLPPFTPTHRPLLVQNHKVIKRNVKTPETRVPEATFWVYVLSETVSLDLALQTP